MRTPSVPGRLWSDASLSAVVAGVLAVIVSFGGPAAIIFQAARAADLDPGQVSSWIWTVAMGSGVVGLGLSLRYRTPVIIAWSTPGAALLAAGWSAYSYGEAVGAFLVSGAVVALFGITGLFSAAMERIPKAVVAAMLAGILFKFGADVFTSLKSLPALAAPMLVCYLAARRFTPRYAILAVLAVGAVLARWQGLLDFGQVELSLARPVWTEPVFSASALIGLGAPLCLAAMAGQNATGLGVLRAAGYRQVPAGPLVATTGLVSVLLAPFGCHGINLAAITAAICTGREAHADPDRRYVAGVACGLAYVMVGLFGGALAAAFTALPPALVSVVSGLALFGAIISSLTQAMATPEERESALVTLLVTASGLTLAGVGAPFWGLLAGTLTHLVLNGGGEGRAAAQAAK